MNTFFKYYNIINCKYGIIYSDMFKKHMLITTKCINNILLAS